MHVLVVIMQYGYGRKELGVNSEYYNLYLTLKEMVEEVRLFDYMTRLYEVGREQMNQELIETVLEFKPDLTLFSMYTDQFIPSVLDEIGRHTLTAYYAYDDMWRKEYVDKWAPHFTYVITSHIKGVQNLLARGHPNGIYLSLGVNHKVYAKKDLLPKYDVTFIGGWHPHRAWLISWIEKSGVKVETWGQKWKNGPIAQEGMVDVINQSRINLNLQNETCWDIRYLFSSPRAIRSTLKSKKHFAPVNLRTFEINSCGGFQLLPYMEGLEKRYEIGNEVELFYTPEQLVERVHYYLKHSDEREAIAKRGYERTLREHTMEKRFTDLFDAVGLQN
jgi:spore maturation protein CgeB